jgi:MFS transporter, FHS family, glucose/mannose:H+ symporter
MPTVTSGRLDAARRLRASARNTGYAAFLLIGWTGLLVPSLIRSLERDLDQTDAGIGIFYFLYSVGYALGSFVGGMLTERLGRRAMLTLAAALHGAGLIGLGLTPGWTWFLLLAAPAGLGAGGLDGGVNGLFLDLFATGRGRALNNLHLFFGVGALSAPLVIGLLTEAGVDWRLLIAGSGVVAFPLAAAIGSLDVPAGRHARSTAGAASDADAAGGLPGGRWRRALPIVLLGSAIGTYVAAEVGVSSWLVRFLASAPLVVATSSLSGFWAGLAVGRLVSARIADRFDHARFAAAASGAAAVALVGAIVVPWLPVSIALFALVGFAFGPIFPMIIALGGERYPARAAAISGTLVGLAVVGGLAYPPAMGFISVSFGLPLAMLGTAVMTAACAVALLLVTPREVALPPRSA